MQDPWNQTGGSINSPPFSQPINGHGHDLILLMGELRERSRHTLEWCQRFDRRLDHGEARFDYQQTQIDHGHAEIRALKAHIQAKPKDPLPGWEVAIKRPMPWIIGVVALAITGKLEVAVRLVEALSKIAEAAK